MEQKKEAVYLINDERYLHLLENGAGVGFATYNKVTGEQLESGQISEKNLPPDGGQDGFCTAVRFSHGAEQTCRNQPQDAQFPGGQS